MAARTEDLDEADLMALGERMLAEVMLFNTQILGVPIPLTPRPIGEARGLFRLGHMREELEEFEQTLAVQQLSDADKVADLADAMVDLIYVAMGTLLEMGVTPGAAFAAVHDANMKKRRGEVAKRPGAMGHDAVKPEGWAPPDMVEACFSITPEIARNLSPVFIEAAKVRATKGQDYNATVDLGEYFPLGHASYYQMVHVKGLRLRNLVTSGREPNHESLRDTIVDQANYLSYWGEAIDKGEL